MNHAQLDVASTASGIGGRHAVGTVGCAHCAGNKRAYAGCAVHQSIRSVDVQTGEVHVLFPPIMPLCKCILQFS